MAVGTLTEQSRTVPRGVGRRRTERLRRWQAGKTAMLNALCGAIPARERVIAVEAVFDIEPFDPDEVADIAVTVCRTVLGVYNAKLINISR